MARFLKILFFLFFIKPIILIILGLNIWNREKLPIKGPAVIAANHNSHLDTMVIMSMYPLSKIHKVRPIAAADYFLKNKVLAWFSLNCIGIIPLDRSGASDRNSLFEDCSTALDQGDILILFPEGSRGEPDQLGEIKKGLYHLVKDREDTPITPLIMQGLGKALPKGEALFVPFTCDVVIGDPLEPPKSSGELVETISYAFNELLQISITSDIDNQV